MKYSAVLVLTVVFSFRLYIQQNSLNQTLSNQKDSNSLLTNYMF